MVGPILQGEYNQKKRSTGIVISIPENPIAPGGRNTILLEQKSGRKIETRVYAHHLDSCYGLIVHNHVSDTYGIRIFNAAHDRGTIYPKLV